MRILIVGPPRAGNRWLKCLLARTYDLMILRAIPNDVAGLGAKISEGWFLKHSIFHQHFEPTDEFFYVIDPVHPSLVTIIRNPYDMFVSLYFFVQNFQKHFGPEHHLFILRDKPIDHPDVLKFLRDEELGYRVYLELANDWINSEKTVTIRYEGLLEDPLRELQRLVDIIEPVEKDKINRAIADCSVQEMRKHRGKNAKHIRKGVAGDYKTYLSDVHLKIFQTYYQDLIQALGYELPKI